MVKKRSAGRDPITLFLCGDVMTGRGVDQVLPHPCAPRLCEPDVKSALEYVELAEVANGPIPKPVAFAYIWGDAIEALRRMRPDVRIINLETSVTTSEDCLPKGINYRMSPENIPCLTAAGIDCCVLANNHVLDWGRSGLIETLDTLRNANLRSAGAGRDIEEAQAPAALEVPGKGRVLVYAFGSATSGIAWDWAAGKDTPGINLLPDLSHGTVGKIAERVSRERRPEDIVVASVHWGGNWGYRVPPQQTDFAHMLIDEAGVDIVHGHSSHHPKAIEIYNGKPILYGCGDFLTDYEGIPGYEEYRDDLVLMYFLSTKPADGELVQLKMAPFEIKNFRLHRTTQADTEWLWNILAREYRKFGTRLDLAEDGTLAIPLR